MIYDEVTQDRTEAGSGNCTEATIASILRVPLVSVPDLWTGSFEEPRSDERWLALHAWLKKQGKKIAYIEYKNTYPRLIYQYNGLLFIIDNDKLYEHMQSWPTVSMVWGPEA